MPVAIIYQNGQGRGDLLREVVNSVETNLLIDGGLESAVHISLLTNRRADPGDPVPADGDLQGWCLDSLGDEPRPWGSKLWLLVGGKLPPPAVTLAARYAREALEWMVDDGIADRIETEARRIAHGVLGIGVKIHKPGAPSDRWEEFWVEVSRRTLTEF